MKGIIMNRSKLITASALATVLTAGAAQAEMSVSGLFAGAIVDNDGGLTHSNSTESFYISYSDSLDNGMGVSVVMSITSAIVTDVNIDTGMGTVMLGDGVDSAVDANDGNPACFSLVLCGSASVNGSTSAAGATWYDDGDAASGQSIGYKSPAINGFTFTVTRGMETDSAAATAGACINTTSGAYTAVTAGNDCAAGTTRLHGTDAVEGKNPTMSYAVSGSVMGLGIKAGVSQIDNKGSTADTDPSFVTASYSIAGLNLGFANYDGDGTTEETTMGVGTTLMGNAVGVTFSDTEVTGGNDIDMMRLSASKSFGAMSIGVDYTETDVAGGAGSDTDVWSMHYVVGF